MTTATQQFNLIQHLQSSKVVGDVGVAVLERARVASYEDLYAFLRHFPGVAANVGVDVPQASQLAQTNLTASVRAGIDAETSALPPSSSVLGAFHPPSARWPQGMAVPLSSAMPAVPALVAGGPIDVRPRITWAIRDQWKRGTCVAHAVAALAEYLSTSNGIIPDLSEQFLFAWAKKLDGRNSDDGTWIHYAAQALRVHGTIDEMSLRYNPEPVSKNDRGQVDSLLGAAATPPKMINLTCFAPPAHATGTAQRLYNLLATNGMPAAISVAVFDDPAVRGQHNWNTTNARRYGEVQDPLPTMIAGGGHAVCVTGYVPDANAAGGGWFVIRNSWGTDWGANLPASGHPAPEPGWGAISAEYVENNSWEIAQA